MGGRQVEAMEALCALVGESVWEGKGANVAGVVCKDTIASLSNILLNHSQGNGLGMISWGKKILLSLTPVKLCAVT